MSIIKVDDLHFEREFPSMCGDMNDSHDIEFNKEGVEIDYDTISWDEIKKAHKVIFGTDISDT